MKKVIASLLAVAVVLALWFYIAKSGRVSPNILIVTCDTLRADRLHLYGNTRPTSPRLDALAKESVVFDRFYASSSFTPPTHASILTGKHVPTHQILWWDSVLSPAVKTVAELIGTPAGATTGLGYRTGAFVNLENFNSLGLVRGFEHVRSQTWFPGPELNQDFFAWLDGGKDGRPFCTWMHFWDPHRPYAWRQWNFLAPPPKSAEEIQNMSDSGRGLYERTLAASKRAPMEFNEMMFGKGSPGVGRSEGHYNRPAVNEGKPVYVPVEERHRALTAADDQFLVDRFDGGVAFTDGQLGVLVDGLRERGLLENTILVITADHGETFTERGDQKFTHDPHLYEQVTRVPFVIRFPKGEFGGRRIDALSASVDILPTIYDYLGLWFEESTNRPFQGRSLLPVIRNGSGDGSAYVFSQTQDKKKSESTGAWTIVNKKYAVRSATHRLVAEPADAREAWKFEWYDLASDPMETKNIHTNPPSEAEAKCMEALYKWLKSSSAAAPGDRTLTEAELKQLELGGYILSGPK